MFVLLHSPSAGPATWSAAAGRLTDAGSAAVVPSLLAAGEGGPPFWPRMRSLPCAHLHQVIDPAGVARSLLELAR